jgi:diacylglycerol kinase (ATP)
MQVTVIHNPDAGEDTVTAAALLAELRVAGHRTVYASTKDPGWEAAVQEAGDVVLAAGGDGTIGKVARLLMGSAARLALVPLGTANNIAMSLGVVGPWQNIVSGIGYLREQPLDVGVAEGPWGVRIFLEGLGFGLIPEIMALADHDHDEVARNVGAEVELVRDLTRAQAVVCCFMPQACRLLIDGAALEADALLVAVMNLCAVGPRFVLAPDARPADDVLHVVVARADDRPALERYVESRLEGVPVPLRLEARTARVVEVEWPAAVAHVDDLLWRGDPGGIRVRATTRSGALRVLVPGRG